MPGMGLPPRPTGRPSTGGHPAIAMPPATGPDPPGQRRQLTQVSRPRTARSPIGSTPRRALRIGERLGDSAFLCRALRVHGDELRKVGRVAAATARLQYAARIATGAERGAVLIQLARAVADLGSVGIFDTAFTDLCRLIGTMEPTPVAKAFVVCEVRLRGLLATGRLGDATAAA
jgi:hypothetical protein